jgi:fructose-bisphosphate aldolase class I
MHKEQAEKMKTGKGFIAALDQSGGSTPKALARYGISNDEFDSDEKMFALVHKMRTRIIKSEAFSQDHILAAILFEKTMDSKIDSLFTGDYLWLKKGIIPILKVDSGLQEEKNGVQLMKPIKDLDNKLNKAKEKNIFGTKMRSVIKGANPEGIREIVKQQFDYGIQIIDKGFIPILEPEVDINSPDKLECENILKNEILDNLSKLSKDQVVMFKLTIPDVNDLYLDIINHANVMRVVALSGGYTREDAVAGLESNKGLIASFSRAFLEGLDVNQTDEEFDKVLKTSSTLIYEASLT